MTAGHLIPLGKKTGGGGVQSIVAGTNISVDNTDPLNPVVNSLSDRYKTTSTTSQAIVSTGTLTFTVGAGLSYIPMQDVIIVANSSNYMYGTITSYTGTTMVVSIQDSSGSGTHTSWVINLDGLPVEPSVTPGGDNQSVQYNNGGIFEGARNVQIQKDDLALGRLAEDPTDADRDFLKVYPKSFGTGGELFLSTIDEMGIKKTLQTMLSEGNIGYRAPPGNATTAPGVMGFPAPTTGAYTVTPRTVATTNYLTRLKRLGYVSPATVGAVGQRRLQVHQYTVGDATTNLGGFLYSKTFAITDTAPVATARHFEGMRTALTLSNVEPSTLTKCFGIGHGASGGNMRFFYGGTVAQPSIDLGPDFPSGNTGAVYRYTFFSPRYSGNVYYLIERLDTGASVLGFIENTGATVLPTNTDLLAPRGWRSNNTTALAVATDVVCAYIQ